MKLQREVDSRGVPHPSLLGWVAADEASCLRRHIFDVLRAIGLVRALGITQISASEGYALRDFQLLPPAAEAFIAGEQMRV